MIELFELSLFLNVHYQHVFCCHLKSKINVSNFVIIFVDKELTFHLTKKLFFSIRNKLFFSLRKYLLIFLPFPSLYCVSLLKDVCPIGKNVKIFKVNARGNFFCTFMFFTAPKIQKML